MVVTAAFALLLVVLAIVGGLWQRSLTEARRAEAANLFSLAQLRLEDHPSAAVAYAIASLELADNPEVRELIVNALWKGPTELRLPTRSPYSVDFSPDGRWLSTAAEYGEAKLWPSDGGPPTILEPRETTGEGRISPTSNVIAYTLGMSEIGLWSFPAGRFLRSWDLGGTFTQNFWFSSDGNRLITSTEFGIKEPTIEVLIRSWPVAGGEPDLVARLEVPRESNGTFFGVDPSESRLAWVDGKRFNIRPLAASNTSSAPTVSLDHDRPLATAVFDEEGRKLATADAVGTIRVWSLDSAPPELIRTLTGPAYLNSWSVRFDPAGEMIATSDGHLWDLESPPDSEPIRLRRTPGIIEREKEEGGFGLDFHPESRWLATGYSYSVSLWPLARPYPRVLRGHEGWIAGLQFTRDGKRLVSASQDGTVRVWPLHSGSGESSRVLYRGLGTWDAPRALAVAPNTSFVALGTYSGQVWVLPFDGGPARELAGINDLIGAVAIDAGSRRVAASTGALLPEEAHVRVWDLETGEERILDAGDGLRIEHLEFADDGSLWVASGVLLRHWELAGDEPRLLEEIEVSDPKSLRGSVRDLHLEDLQVLFAGSDSKLVGRPSLHDLDARTLRDLGSHGDLVRRAVFDPSGRLVISGDLQGRVRVGSAQGDEPYLLLGHKGEINSLAVSPDGQWIASGSDDDMIYLWPMPNLDKPPLHTLPHDELLAKLRSLTNLRAVRDEASSTGWSIEIGPFPGWKEVPEW